MQNCRRWFVLAAVSAIAAAPMLAQDSVRSSPARSGYYFGGGLGWGALDDSCSGSCSTTGWTSTCCVTLYVGVGGTLSPQWRLGAEEFAAAHLGSSEDDSQGASFPPQAVSFLSLAATYYPSLTGNLWIKVSAGIAIHLPSDVSISTGMSGGAGIGYDWLPGHGDFAVIPFVDYEQQFTGGNLNGTSTTVRASLLQVGVAFGSKH